MSSIIIFLFWFIITLRYFLDTVTCEMGFFFSSLFHFVCSLLLTSVLCIFSTAPSFYSTSIARHGDTSFVCGKWELCVCFSWLLHFWILSFFSNIVSFFLHSCVIMSFYLFACLLLLIIMFVLPTDILYFRNRWLSKLKLSSFGFFCFSNLLMQLDVL